MSQGLEVARRANGPRPRSAAELDPLAAALEIYRNRLLADADALAYPTRRGLKPRTRRGAPLGLCAGRELAPYASWRKIPVAVAHFCGLLTRDGAERLAGCVVIPDIRAGQPVRMIGRLLGGDRDEPKYPGLPGAQPLLGWDAATRDTCGVHQVEGPVDVLVLRQFGVPALALYGTGISAEALRLVARGRLRAVRQ